MIFTLTPFCILVLIMLPCILAKLVLGTRLQTSPWKDRYQKCKVSMCSNILFFVFMIYPMVSITSLKGLHCRDFGPPISSLLVSDLQVACPWAAGGSNFLFMYTLVFVFVYPVGVPLCLYLVMRAYDVPGLAQKKIMKNCLSVMIQMFMAETCPIALKKFARLVRNID